jgi:caffeoyl-CoA O-methyltransferase
MPRGATTEFSAEIGAYLARQSRQDDVLARVEREIAGQPRASMQVQPDQGALLTLLVRAIGARDALEVGTFTGYSAICIARGLPEGGRLTCLELDPDFASTAQRNLEDAGVADRVSIEVGPAGESLARMPAEPAFDFVFLDADKSGYLDYYEMILPRLRTNGLLLVDNTLLGGRVLDPQDDSARAVAALNERIAADERVDSTMVFIADGIAFVRKR